MPSLAAALAAALPLLPLFPVAAAGLHRSGPADLFSVRDTLLLSDFTEDAPLPNPPRELHLILPEAITLSVSEKCGIPGGGGVSEVPVSVRGSITVVLPLTDHGFDYPHSRADLIYTGAQTIRASARLEPHPEHPLTRSGQTIAGRVRFPVQLALRDRQAAPRDLDIDLDLKIAEETFQYSPDPDPSIPPWRADKSKPNGNRVVGHWRTLEHRTDAVVELAGPLSPRSALRGRAMPGRFAPVGATDLGRDPRGGLAITAFAAPVRVDQADSQWAVKLLEKPLDLRKFNGLRLTVRSDEPFAGKDWIGPAPVGAAVAIREKGGQWFTCRTVTPLLGGTQSWIADLGLFLRGTPSPGIGGGPNTRYFLDPSQIDAIAVGVNNPFGVGTVRFSALKLEAVRWDAHGFGEIPEAVAEIFLQPGCVESFNGIAHVPKGLFGFHVAGSINPTPASFDNTPQTFRDPPVSGDPLALLRILRPGALRPLEHTGMSAGAACGIHGMRREIAEAGDAADSVMFTVTNQNLWARPKWMDAIRNDTPENLAATREQYAAGIRKMFAEIGTRGWHPTKRPDSTLRFIEFWNEPFMWARHINRGNSTLSAGPGDPGGNRGQQAWNDPTQFTFIPGRLGAEMYAHFFNAAHDGLAEANPHVQIGGMSGPPFLEEFGDHLRGYWLPFLEISRDRVDFLTEHHYQGHPESFAASYETVTAHTLARLGKAWPIWNTEANDLQDVAPGDERSPEAARAFTHMNRAYYNYRDILELIRYSRDKVAGRALHALWSPGFLRDDGEFHMYRLAANLRGELLAARSSDPAILPVAVSNVAGQFLYLLNDSPHPRNVSIAIEGQVALAETDPCLALSLDEAAGQTAIEAVGIKSTASPDQARLVFERPMRPREIRRIALGPATKTPILRETTQHFADVSLVEIAPGKPVTGNIALRQGVLPAQAASGVVRVVTRDVQEGEATIELAGSAVSIALPPSRTGADSSVVQEIPLSRNQLTALAKAAKGPAIPIGIRCDSCYDGFGLSMVSLNLSSKP